MTSTQQTGVAGKVRTYPRVTVILIFQHGDKYKKANLALIV